MEGNQQNNVTANKVERKVMEKNRRNKMKSLYAKLNSLLPAPLSNEPPPTVSEQIEKAIKYIKSLETKLKNDEEKKESFLKRLNMPSSSSSLYTTPSKSQNRSAPELKIKEMGSVVEVVLTTGLEDRSVFYEIIHIFHEERAKIISVNYSVLKNTIVHSLHGEIEDVVYEFGGTKLIERLKRLVYETKNDAEMQAAAVSSSHDGTAPSANTPTTSSDNHFWSH